MKLDWERPGVLRATLKVEEMAALVAGARLAAAALAAQSAEQADSLERVLAGFDRALGRLGAGPATPATDGADGARSPAEQGGRPVTVGGRRRG
jgi:hypothetical protein